jgi:hypothetical protein
VLSVIAVLACLLEDNNLRAAVPPFGVFKLLFELASAYRLRFQLVFALSDSLR